MKVNKLWAWAMAALAFVSCGKDVEPTGQEERPAPSNTKEVYVELGASQDYQSEEMRAVFGLNNDPESPDFGKTTGLMMSDKDVVLRVAVRQGEGWPVVQDIVFKKIDGRNHASYKGKITVPTGGTGKYTISAILLREVDGVKFMDVAKDASEPTDAFTRAELLASYNYVNNRVLIPAVDANTLEMNVPYITRWQPLDVDGDAAVFTTLHFMPQGTILRMRIRNDDTAERTFYRIKMVSTAFVHRGSFISSEERDGLPAWFPWNEETFYLEIPNGVVVPGVSEGKSSYSSWMYIWVMPRKRDFVGRRTIGSLGLNRAVDHVYYPAFETRQELPVGSVPMTLVYYGNGSHQGSFGDLDDNGEWGEIVDQPKNPLLRTAEYVLDTTGKAFVTTNDNNQDPTVGFFSFDEIVAMKSIQINGTEYHAPSRNEMVAILPPYFDKTGIGADKLRVAGAYNYDIVEQSVQLGNLTKDFKADYYLGTDATVYALRLKDGTNKFRTAFRYKAVGGQLGQPETALEISAVFVGNRLISIEDVKEPTFWTDNQDNVVTRKFPLYGSQNIHQAVVQKVAVGSNLILFTCTPYDEGAGYLSYIQWRARAPFVYVSPGSVLRATPALLFTK